MHGARRALALMVAAIVAITTLVAVDHRGADEASAASAANFDPGNIISDTNFFQGGAMSADAVQRFLEQRLASCDAGYTCMRSYAQATPAVAANAYCAAMGGSAWESASSIIARIGAACNVSQRVLLVLLEKEQSLVTDRNPSARQFDRATGFACPDTAPCDPAYGGFFYQVYNAARQFQVYKARPGSYNHVAGRNNAILFHPNSACGTSTVRIANQATAGLYNYTPYQPNAAALANLYSTGDACSSYGNRNFWRIFTDWFGDPRGPLMDDPSPFGQVQAWAISPDRARMQGFAIDFDAPTSPIDLHLYVDGRWGGAFRADVYRPDVGSAYPQAGPTHGFDFSFSVGAPALQACVYGINVGKGDNVLLGCVDMRRQSGNAFGNIDSAVASGRTAIVSGWAIDPDVTAPIAIHAYVNGAWGGSYTADAVRADVGEQYWGYGANHGMSLRIPIPVGTSELCLFTINAGPGDNAPLGCRMVSNASGPPIGNLERINAGLGAIDIGGWMLDPDQAEPITAIVTVDGREVTRIQAEESRPDIARAYPGYGERHGFSASMRASGGTHEVCVHGTDIRGDANRVVSCRSVTVPGGSPKGSIDAVAVGASAFTARVSGWAIDPDVADAVVLHAYVNGAWAGSHTASLTRADVGRAYPLYGANHGFAIDVPIQAGSNTVCVFGIDVGLGENELIGCRDVQGPSGTPFGNVERLESTAAGSIDIAGWLIDPDTPNPGSVHVYVDGAWGGAFAANGTRADVGRAYPGYGSAHGFSTTITVPKGARQVCIYGINVGIGDHALMTCRTVTA